jgi:Smg protein
MKDSLFEMLMEFFEESLTKIKDSTKKAIEQVTKPADRPAGLFIKPASDTALRVFTQDEQSKLTKPSYQFLRKMMLYKIISPELMEQIITKLCNSDSRFVTLQETKWVIRSLIGVDLDPAQMAFLDLILYQKEDRKPLH